MTILFTILSFLRANWKPVLIIALVSAFALYWHHAGYASGKATATKMVAAANLKADAAAARAEASDRNSVEWSKDLAMMKAAQVQRDAADAYQAQQSTKALAQSQEAAKAAQIALKTALARTRTAVQGVTCKGQVLPAGIDL